MKIAYTTIYDAQDIHKWSGLGYMIANALERQGNEIDFIGGLKSSPAIDMYLKKLYFKILRKDFDFGREPHTASEYGKQIKALLKDDTDIIFSPGTIPISLLETNKPKVFYTDATFAGMIGFYKDFSNLSSETIKHGNFLEKAGLESARLAIYSSDWAAQSAIKHYGVNPEKVKVVPFGANLESSRSLDDVKQMVSRRPQNECHLLFLAVNWERKGGDIAVKIAGKLNEVGIKTILHVAGIKEIPMETIPSFVVNHGFISKSNKEGQQLINKLLSTSHFLLLPTRADCTPVVFSEANSFGLPCITTNVGGIPTIIRDDVNGKTFPLDASVESYAGYIQSVFEDKKRYADSAASSFHEYESRLNWDIAGKTINDLMKDL
ncbi:glycosyltransferase family 4 protein [Dyadobacter sp. CY261]|uniref:glycosyltransferase family 4 protein n=1 Tax=Dyadobacter sp. CY261 TaxID=2907203 RepID=UPI001F28191F|nr:glycosyltransferase family 4 protein [Dyadobacter sp. CY261]MCF0074498.1 glycosyltransferase family 4 protein [Dyadobacter sp. CY261]